MKNLLVIFSISLLLINDSFLKSQTLFVEDSSLVIVEVEAINDIKQWDLETVVYNDYAINFLQWTGNQYLNNPGNQLLEYKILINNPGTYRFLWHSKVGFGNSSTDHNDDWLKIPDAADFYGRKGSDTVQPKGVCTNNCPEGAGASGWFKIYSSGSTDWTWSTRTSDNEGYEIYAQFDTAGIYTIQISARSSYHQLDRFILFNEAVYNHKEVTNLHLASSNMLPFTVPSHIILIGDSSLKLPLKILNPVIDSLYVTLSDSSSIAEISISAIKNDTAWLHIKGKPDFNHTGTVQFYAPGYSTENPIHIRRYMQIAQINLAPTVDTPADTSCDITQNDTLRIKLTGITDGNKGDQEIKIEASSLIDHIIGEPEIWYTQKSDTAILILPLTGKGSTNIYITVEDNGGNELGGKSSYRTFFFLNVVQTLNAVEAETKKKFTVYPNPVIDKLNIRDNHKEIARIKIFDMSGKLLIESNNPGNNALNIAYLPVGYYHFIAVLKDNSVHAIEFLKSE